jgi:hypothetical protein
MVGGAFVAAACTATYSARAAAGATVGDTDTSPEQFEQCRLVRDIFGNPFRAPPPPPPSVRTWNDGTVLRLATATYEDRVLPAGTFRADRVAVLADALEEAGCRDADLLGHLRGPVPHVRGCFAVDLLLGRS